jgi:hypothetical protein
MDPNGTTVPEKITINGQEYAVEDAQSLIDLGSKTREAEQKYSTSFDKVWPAYGESQTELTQTKKELDEAKRTVAEYEAKLKKGTETPTDTTEARKAAKELGIVLNEDLEQSGYIKKDDLPNLFQSYMAEQRAVDQVLSEAGDLEKKIDGSDGRPKFNRKAVLAYADAYNIPDLEEAYKEMNSESLKTWEDAQIKAGKKPGLTTLKPGGSKEPPAATKVNDGNVNNLLKETLWGQQE